MHNSTIMWKEFSKNKPVYSIILDEKGLAINGNSKNQRTFDTWNRHKKIALFNPEFSFF